MCHCIAALWAISDYILIFKIQLSCQIFHKLFRTIITNHTCVWEKSVFLRRKQNVVLGEGFYCCISTLPNAPEQKSAAASPEGGTPCFQDNWFFQVFPDSSVWAWFVSEWLKQLQIHTLTPTWDAHWQFGPHRTVMKNKSCFTGVQDSVSKKM